MDRDRIKSCQWQIFEGRETSCLLYARDFHVHRKPGYDCAHLIRYLSRFNYAPNKVWFRRRCHCISFWLRCRSRAILTSWQTTSYLGIEDAYEKILSARQV